MHLKFRLLLRLAVRLLASLGALWLLITFTPLVNRWAAALANPWEDSTGEVLIVLGADTLGNGFIGRTSYWRAVYAVRAWRGGRFRQILLSGESHTTEPMRALMIVHGVPPEAIEIEGRSVSTRENALYVAALLAKRGGGKRVLLTSDYHMYRAVRVFRKAGCDVSPRPFPDALKRGQNPLLRFEVFLDLVTETAKIGYYRYQGWI